jgi:hypothetical protein
LVLIPTLLPRSPTTPTDSSFHLRILAKISFLPNLDNRSAMDLQRRKMVLQLREINPANRSRVHCVYFAYYHVIPDTLLAVCSTSTRAVVLPWMRSSPILGCRMPTCVGRKKEESVITLLVIPMFWSPAVRLRHHLRSRGRRESKPGRGVALKAALSHVSCLRSFG